MAELESASLPLDSGASPAGDAVTETTLRGEVEKVIYQSDDDSFSILNLKDSQGNLHCVFGAVSGAQVCHFDSPGEIGSFLKRKNPEAFFESGTKAAGAGALSPGEAGVAGDGGGRGAQLCLFFPGRERFYGVMSGIFCDKSSIRCCKSGWRDYISRKECIFDRATVLNTEGVALWRTIRN